MIECTFSHVKSVYRKGELRLWQSGITSWEKLIAMPNPHPHFTKKMWNNLRKEIINCQKAWKEQNIDYFLTHFDDEQLWRMFTNFQDKILYFDCEMTGLDINKDELITIAAFDGKTTRFFIKGQNLDDFGEYVQKFPAICTFDGERADIPFIEKDLKIFLDNIHFDLFKMSRFLGLSGGLKQIEFRLGINRDDLTGVDGRFAIELWRLYKLTNDEQYLETLLAYNAEDAVNLEEILYSFYLLLQKQEHFPEKRILHEKSHINIPYSANPSIIEEITTILEEEI
ncbi:MAG: ribonuclease H-like domain-containing protein [Promethearchaeota archaeon]